MLCQGCIRHCYHWTALEDVGQPSRQLVLALQHRAGTGNNSQVFVCSPGLERGQVLEVDSCTISDESGQGVANTVRCFPQLHSYSHTVPRPWRPPRSSVPDRSSSS